MTSSRDDPVVYALIEAQRPGYSLDQAFYRDDAIFERDCERVLRRHWFMAGHVSEIPNPGDYGLFDVASESIVLVRGLEGAVHAHYNVCRHRGSRILLAPTGNATSITCGYHGWSYTLDGRLGRPRGCQRISCPPNTGSSPVT